MDRWIRVVRARQCVDGDLHRDPTPRADQAGSRPDMLGGDVVHRSELVVRAPSAPVLDRLVDRLELGEADLLTHRAALLTLKVQATHRARPPALGGTRAPARAARRGWRRRRPGGWLAPPRRSPSDARGPR